MKYYLETLIPKVMHQNIQQRTADLAQSFIQHGQKTINKSNYSKVYSEMVDQIQVQGMADKVGKRKFGCTHLPELTTNGQVVLVHKQIIWCKKRQAPPTEALRTKTEKYEMDIDNY